MKLEELYKVIQKRMEEKKDGSYVAKLVSGGTDRVIQKIGEEAIEVVIAAKNSGKDRLISESADLLFHLLILLSVRQITLADIEKELMARKK
ncbi:MAG: phosphoribosyl-ATP diphosphatase [Microgenomates group bacterium]